MRRFVGGLGRRAEAHARGLSPRDIRAIRHAIMDAPTPGMQDDLMAAAYRQGINVFR